MELSRSLCEARCAAIAASVKGGSLQIWTGTKPATCEASPSGQMMVKVPLGGEKAKGDTLVLIPATVRMPSLVAGTPSFFRLCNADGDCQMQGPADMFGSQPVEEHQLLEIKQWSISE